MKETSPFDIPLRSISPVEVTVFWWGKRGKDGAPKAHRPCPFLNALIICNIELSKRSVGSEISPTYWRTCHW